MSINPYSAPQADLPVAPPDQVELELDARPDEIPTILKEIQRSRRLPFYVVGAVVFSVFVGIYAFLSSSGRDWGFQLLMISICVRVWTIAFIRWRLNMIAEKYLITRHRETFLLKLDETFMQIRGENYLSRMEYNLLADAVITKLYMVIRVPLLSTAYGLPCSWVSEKLVCSYKDLVSLLLPKRLLMSSFSKELSPLRVDDYDLGAVLAVNESTVRASHAKGVLTREFLLHGKLNLVSIYFVIAGGIIALTMASARLSSYFTIGAAIVFLISIRKIISPHYLRWLLSQDPVLSEHRLTLYDTGIESLSNGGIARVAYDRFERVATEDQQVYLISRLTGEPSLMISKDGFKAIELYEQFVELLKHKIQPSEQLELTAAISKS